MSRSREPSIDAADDIKKRSRISPLAIVYGALGLLPFWLPLAAAAAPSFKPAAAAAQSLYAGLILAFLAGARFEKGAGKATTLSLSMIGPVFALAALAPQALPASVKCLLLAIGLAMQGAWDLSTPRPPAGYRALRIGLTVGASAALLLGAWLLAGG